MVCKAHLELGGRRELEGVGEEEEVAAQHGDIVLHGSIQRQSIAHCAHERQSRRPQLFLRHTPSRHVSRHISDVSPRCNIELLYKAVSEGHCSRTPATISPSIRHNAGAGLRCCAKNAACFKGAVKKHCITEQL